MSSKKIIATLSQVTPYLEDEIKEIKIYLDVICTKAGGKIPLNLLSIDPGLIIAERNDVVRQEFLNQLRLEVPKLLKDGIIIITDRPYTLKKGMLQPEFTTAKHVSHHKIPLWMGGVDRPENLVLIPCTGCTSKLVARHKPN